MKAGVDVNADWVTLSLEAVPGRHGWAVPEPGYSLAEHELLAYPHTSRLGIEQQWEKLPSHGSFFRNDGNACQ